MQSIVCLGCRRPLLNEHSGRNIFDDDSLIKSLDSYCDHSYNKKWYMKLYSGIEIITGQKLQKEEKLPQKLCEICFQNVETYINFRFQLLRSTDILLSSSYQNSKTVTDNKSVETKHLQLLNSSISKVNTNESIKKLPEVKLFQTEFCTSSLITNTTIMNNFLSKTVPEDLINVDENSTSLDVHCLCNKDEEANEFLTSRIQHDHKNNNLTDSNRLINNFISTNIEEINVKQSDYDVESEIDVCSGEDDDILELDIQKMKNETVEIDSSSESDIEVCDYEPTDKRGNYNTLSQTITF